MFSTCINDLSTSSADLLSKKADDHALCQTIYLAGNYVTSPVTYSIFTIVPQFTSTAIKEIQVLLFVRNYTSCDINVQLDISEAKKTATILLCRIPPPTLSMVMCFFCRCLLSLCHFAYFLKSDFKSTRQGMPILFRIYISCH